MNKLILALIGIVAFSVNASAQSASLPAASASSITVPFSDASCTATNTCSVSVYVQPGQCPASLSGSTGWTLAATSSLPGTGTVTVTTGITSNTQYAVAVEASPTSSPTSYSGPSNCASVTTPFHPAPPVLGTLSAS